MDTIIQEIVNKIMENSRKNLEVAITGGRPISEFIQDTQKMLNEIGVLLVKEALETMDELVKESKWRKEQWYIERRKEEKTLTTIFGDVVYERTYYKHKTRKEYSYLSDEQYAIEAHDRMDLLMRSRLVENALDLSYQKSGKRTSSLSEFSNQTVMNSIRELKEIKNEKAPIKEKKKRMELLYIEADEDHVAMQDGSNKEMKLVYVHEGKEWISKDRFQLINPRYFTGFYANSEDLWLEVANYIDKAYETDHLKKVYLSGDGAKWIKEGLGWIKNSEYVLDRFHLSKYIKKATAHLPYITNVMWDYIHAHDKKSMKDLFQIILEDTESETKKEAVKESRRYILNNWEGILNQYEKDYIGCSAEGHVSHILSARLSSRPLSWSNVGADQMARLRVFKLNGGNIYELMKETAAKEKKEKKIVKLEKRLVNKRLNTRYNETLDNLTILKIGKRTWANQWLNSIRGA